MLTEKTGNERPRIVLASASPRRRELLSMLGLKDFLVLPARGEEHPPKTDDPAEIVRSLASAKAREAAAGQNEETLVIAADTIVWAEGRALGKPHSEEEAADMLRLLSGRSHKVYTGVCVIYEGLERCEAECSTVHFRSLSEGEIRRYIESGEPMDKAGAYGIQGKAALFVKGLEGDYYNVMGLPVCLLGEMLRERGVQIL